MQYTPTAIVIVAVGAGFVKRLFVSTEIYNQKGTEAIFWLTVPLFRLYGTILASSTVRALLSVLCRFYAILHTHSLFLVEHRALLKPIINILSRSYKFSPRFPFMVTPNSVRPTIAAITESERTSDG